MQLFLIAAPFDDPDWLFEIKHDGFRALAYISNGSCTLLSRKNNQYKSFQSLRECLAQLNTPAILDGEIVCLDAEGRSHFWPLMSRKAQVSFLCVRPAVAWRHRPAWVAPRQAEAASSKATG